MPVFLFDIVFTKLFLILISLSIEFTITKSLPLPCHFSKLIFNNIFFDFDLLRLNSITTNQASIIPGNNNNGFPLTITDKYYDFRIKLRYNISK